MPSGMNLSSARFTASVDERGRKRFITYKAWRRSPGYKSFRTLPLALQYARQTNDVARIDRIVTTVMWEYGDDLA